LTTRFFFVVHNSGREEDDACLASRNLFLSFFLSLTGPDDDLMMIKSVQDFRCHRPRGKERRRLEVALTTHFWRRFRRKVDVCVSFFFHRCVERRRLSDEKRCRPISGRVSMTALEKTNRHRTLYRSQNENARDQRRLHEEEGKKRTPRSVSRDLRRSDDAFCARQRRSKTTMGSSETSDTRLEEKRFETRKTFRFGSGFLFFLSSAFGRRLKIRTPENALTTTTTTD